MSQNEIMSGLFVVGGVATLAVLVMFIWYKLFYVKVEIGVVLIKNDMTPEAKVYFTGAFVYPIIHMKELMSLSIITMQIDRNGGDGLICKDNIRADIALTFHLKVNETEADVLKVAKSIGSQRASDKQAVSDLFNAKFSEAIKIVGKKMDFIDLFEGVEAFREKIVEVIGDDLYGFVLEDVIVESLEQTPISKLDLNNILDVAGIRKITALAEAKGE